MNIRKIILEEINDFDWAEDEIIPVGRCIVRHMHKLYPKTHSVERLGREINLEYIVVGYEGNDMILRPVPYPDEERFYEKFDKDNIEDNFNDGVTFCIQ